MKKYDLVFGMGAFCSCSECLRMAGLQFSSFPFDWVAGPGMVIKAELLCKGFPGWFAEDSFELIKEPRFGLDAYWRDQWGFTPIHDLNTNEPLAQQLPAVRERYERRVARLRSLVLRGGRVLVVHITPFYDESPADAELAACRQCLLKGFSSATFDILAFRPGKNVCPEIVHPSDGVTTVTFDYRNYTDTTGSNPVNRELVVRFLKRQGYAAVDYRSAAERQAWNAQQKAKEYRRFDAKGWLDYRWAKLQYKLFVHLRKRLSKRGIV